MKKTGIIVIVICFAILAVSIGCIFGANCMSANRASVVGGFLSVIATIGLGLVAYWQNKRYKELSDEYNDRMYMPEIYMPTAFGEKLKAISHSTYNGIRFSVQNTLDEELVAIECGTFRILHAPIIDLSAVLLSVDDKQYMFEKKIYSFYDSDVGFSLWISIPKELIKTANNYILSISYYNIYGTEYTKTMSFSLNENSTYAINWKLDKAQRKM